MLNVVHMFGQNWGLMLQICIVVVNPLGFCRQCGEDNCCQQLWLNTMVSAFHEEFTLCVCFPFSSACFVDNRGQKTLARALSFDS